MRLRFLLIATLSVFILSGCGVRGSLKTPPPVWGDKAQTPEDQTAPETPPSSEPADIEQDEDDNYLEGPY